MDELHRVYLSLGSNIEAEVNIPRAIQLLGRVGRIEAVSSVWETRSVGFDGPNFLNNCVLLLTSLGSDEFREQGIRAVESKLGRVRGADKNAPRTIDVDILLYDGEPLDQGFWGQAFVVVPLAELIPDFKGPGRVEELSQLADRLRSRTWMRKRDDVIAA